MVYGFLTPMTSKTTNDSNGPDGLTGSAGGAQGTFVALHFVGTFVEVITPKSFQATYHPAIAKVTENNWCALV
jgi:hypothetical protein